MSAEVLRHHAEQQFDEELDQLKKVDGRQRPTNWQMSPWAVVTYLMGGQLENGFVVSPKYIGSRRLMETAVATLATDRALLLFGVPGTTKSWVSEHLAAAVSGDTRATAAEAFLALDFICLTFSTRTGLLSTDLPRQPRRHHDTHQAAVGCGAVGGGLGAGEGGCSGRPGRRIAGREGLLAGLLDDVELALALLALARLGFTRLAWRGRASGRLSGALLGNRVAALAALADNALGHGNASSRILREDRMGRERPNVTGIRPLSLCTFPYGLQVGAQRREIKPRDRPPEAAKPPCIRRKR